MLQVTEAVKTALSKSTSVSAVNSCLIEYNMNDLIRGTTVLGPGGIEGSNPEGTLEIVQGTGSNTYKPFTKLFPISSIIDPRRPKSAGIKYLISQDPSQSSTYSSGVSSKNNYSSTKDFPQRVYFSSIKTAYKYWVAKASGTSLSNCILTVSYPQAKTAAANKIVIKFETSHSVPTSFNVKLLGVATPIFTGTNADVVPFTTTVGSVTTKNYNAGTVTIYYNGTSWSTTEPSTIPSGVNLSGLQLQVNSIDTANGYLGIIEISARLVKDVTPSLESFNISQNSSDSINGLVPVGDVTANSLRLTLNSYDKSYENYDKENPFDQNKLNLYKNIIIKPSVTIAAEKINLGVFYLDTYSVDEFGEISINALDGARELQYIKPPDIICKDMSSVAIIRRLLDSIGFTNYNFNLATDEKATVTPLYWFTDNKKTVWQHIQDLCKDIQMIAVFDNKDVLQFYSRGWIFNPAAPIDASFRYNSTSDGKLPNISSIKIENVPSVKAIKVMYNPQITSNYTNDKDNLYTSPVVILGAAALSSTLPETAPAETDASKGVIKTKPVIISGSSDSVLYSYSGYLVIGKEIIEYDAVKYQYMPLGGSTIVDKWIKSDSDIQANQGLAEPNTFKPTGQYRIKTRDAFKTAPNFQDRVHTVNTEGLKSEWQGQTWNSETGLYTNDSTVFKLSETSTLENTNLLNPIPQSMMTITAPSVTSGPDPEDPTKTIYTPNTKYSIASIKPDYKPSFTGSEYFSLGTNMYFPLLKDPATGRATGNQRTISGLAFSLNDDNSSGYFLSVATTQNTTANKAFREINIYKIVDGKPVKLTDSQKEEDSSIVTNISGGKLYKLDIRASYVFPEITPTPNPPLDPSTRYLVLKIYINNKIVVVVDKNPLSVITNKIGLVSQQGISAFDYVYYAALTKEDFESNNQVDPYKGFLSSTSALVKTFDEFVFAKKEAASDKVWLKEFGPVARELKLIKSRYSSPGFPLYTSLVNNSNVTVVGSSLDSFGMETYVLNNTGAFTALANSEEKQFVVVGNFIVSSDSFEYIDPSLSEADKQEQVGFDSTWLQRESEAKELSEWMTKQWANQQRVVSLETFFNPIIQIGDVVEISYPSNKIYSSEDGSGYTASKYVVLSIDTTYDKDSPPTTSLSCRSIYTG